MALNRKTFQTRSLTAVVFVVLMLAGIFWNQYSYFILFSVIHAGCWWEYLSLLEKIHGKKMPAAMQMGFILVGYGFMIDASGDLAGEFLRHLFFVIISGLGFVIMLVSGLKTRFHYTRLLFGAALGWFYISGCWGLMLDLYGLNFIDRDPGHTLAIFVPMVIIICMWVNDTMAYIVGSMIGKTPFSSISPKKTWEGTLGGIILCALVVGIAAYYLEDGRVLSWPLHYWIFLALVAAIAGTAGDLLESWLKRRAGVKDSGQLMPGHGGFMDRFDSLLLATPACWLLIMILGKA